MEPIWSVDDGDDGPIQVAMSGVTETFRHDRASKLRQESFAAKDRNENHRRRLGSIGGVEAPELRRRAYDGREQLPLSLKLSEKFIGHITGLAGQE